MLSILFGFILQLHPFLKNDLLLPNKMNRIKKFEKKTMTLGSLTTSLYC